MDLEIKQKHRPVYIVQESKLREHYREMLKDMILDTAPTPKDLADFVLNNHKTIDGMDAWELLGYLGVLVEPWEPDMRDAVRENTGLFPDIVDLFCLSDDGLCHDDVEFDLEIRNEKGRLVSIVRSEEMDF
jgi:hypothetical protein